MCMATARIYTPERNPESTISHRPRCRERGRVSSRGDQKRRATAVFGARGRSNCCLLEAAGDSLESVASLLEKALHDARGGLTIGNIVAQGGETVRLAAVLHLSELIQFV